MWNAWMGAAFRSSNLISEIGIVSCDSYRTSAELFVVGAVLQSHELHNFSIYVLKPRQQK